MQRQMYFYVIPNYFRDFSKIICKYLVNDLKYGG